MTDNTKSEEYLEENFNVLDDYKKLQQENEWYQQELHNFQLKLKASEALEKELQDTNEALEQSLAQCTTKTEKLLAEREEKYRAERREYENHIVNVEAIAAQSTEEIVKLREELKKYKEHKNEQLHNLTSNEDAPIEYEKKIEELVIMFQDEKYKHEQLEEKFSSMKNYVQELEDVLQVTKEQLAEKNMALENVREELVVNRMELESLKITPANDACKGNSLFAEVEDRRQMLLGKMNVLQDKYNEVKRELSKKTMEIKSLRVEKAAMVQKWETDVIDTLQENADLLDKYKSKVFELENKLMVEMKRNRQTEEVRLDSDNFKYTEILLATKKKEVEELHNKLEKQSIEILTQEEANHDISKQLRYWRCKAMSLEAQILAIKAELETEEANDNKNLEEVIKNFTIKEDMVLDKTCDLHTSSDMQENICHGKSTNMSERSTVDSRSGIRQKEAGEKSLRFAQDTKDTESKPLKKQPKQYDYPIISIPNILSS